MAATDVRKIVAGQPELDPSRIIFFLRSSRRENARAQQAHGDANTDADDQCWFGDAETGLAVGWSEPSVASAVQNAFGGTLVALSLAEAVRLVRAEGVSFLLRTPEADYEFHPTVRNRSGLH